MPLWTWIATTATVVTGVITLALTPVLHITGIYLLLGPLLVAAGVTSSAILSGLRSPWGVIFLFLGVEAGFIILKFLNPWGIGAVV